MKFSPAIGLSLFIALASFARGNPLTLTPGVSPSMQALTAPRGRAEAPLPANMHPAVVRIVAPGNGSISYGSGTLVYANEKYGLVLTNWHVVNEATGLISVHFPDGFYSIGTIQKADRDWDLAAIAIKRPNVPPVVVANQAPHPGEVLTIVGYGQGEYRAASGRCTQYVAPGTKFPYEMVEVAVSARQGDSGGPIFNGRGELAGVLFGEGNGRTSGSYCGRVKWFLSSVAPDSASDVQRVASTPQAPPPVVAQPLVADTRGPGRGTPVQSVALATSKPAQLETPGEAAEAKVSTPEANLEAGPQEAQYVGWQDVAGETLFEQVKTVFAAVGILGLILHVLHWMSRDRAAAA